MIALNSLMVGASALFSSAAIAPVVPQWTFSAWYAVIGFPVGLAMGSLPWLLIYVSQTVAIDDTPWHGHKILDHGEVDYPETPPLVEPRTRPQHFAYFKKGKMFITLNCKTVGPGHYAGSANRVLSLVAMVVYADICQDEQLRSEATAIWLGAQAFLACVHIIVWLKYPHFVRLGRWLCHESLTEYSVSQSWLHPTYDKAVLQSQDSFTELEYVMLQHHRAYQAWITRKGSSVIGGGRERLDPWPHCIQDDNDMDLWQGGD